MGFLNPLPLGVHVGWGSVLPVSLPPRGVERGLSLPFVGPFRGGPVSRQCPAGVPPVSRHCPASVLPLSRQCPATGFVSAVVLTRRVGACQKKVREFSLG